MNVVPSVNLNNDELIAHQLTCAYIIIAVIFCHCNFSQLACWPKTILATLLSVIMILMARLCLQPHCIQSTIDNDNNTTTTTVASSTTTPITLSAAITDATTGIYYYRSLIFFSNSIQYRAEIFVDLFLAIVLIAFLNYQFEASFRMAFFGDVQAKQDTG